MPDPADVDYRTHAAVDALTVARIKVQLIRRRLARGSGDPVALDDALHQVQHALDRLRDALLVPSEGPAS